MQPVRTFLRRCREFLFKEKFDVDMDEQIRSHLELTTAENIKQGMSPEDARYAALRKFGGVEQVKERAREESGWIWLEQLLRDFRFSLRSLAKVPMFTVTVVTVLALCIGANASVASALYSMLLRPLPFRDAGQLIEVFNQLPKRGNNKAAVSAAQYQDYKEHADLFEGFCLSAPWFLTIGEETEAVRFQGARVSTDYLDLWGVVPYRGSFFAREHANPGTNVVVFAQSFWENYLHADPEIVGKSVRISGEQWTVLGIAPRSVESVDGRVVAFTPDPNSQRPLPRTATAFSMYARLKPGVRIEQGLAQLRTIEQRYLDTEAPPAIRTFLTQAGHRVEAAGIRAEQGKQFKTALWVLQVGVLAVFLLGAANAANLVLARFNARREEMSVRRALGATRLALARGVLIEGFLLTALGSACGLAGGWAAVRVIRSYLYEGSYEQIRIAMDRTIVGFSVLCALGVAFIISLLPLLEIWRGGAAAASARSLVPDAARSATGNRRMRAGSSVLVTIQVALALTLLVSAGLLIRSFWNVLAVDLGFRAEKIVTVRMLVPPDYQAADKAAALHDRMLDRIRAIPGVDSAALISNYLMDTASNPGAPFILRDAASDGTAGSHQAYFWSISPDFFATMGIPLVEGRAFTNADRSLPFRAVIVERRLAERYFPGRSPLGENIGLFSAPPPGGTWPVIVGVVENALLNGADDTSGMPGIYIPLVRGPLTLVLRSSRPVEDVLKAVRQEIRLTDRALPVYQSGTLEDRHDFHLRHRRGMVLLLGSFGAIALLLSAVGLYGMLAYDVSLRTREIGIRGAIGATRQQIIGLIVRQGFGKTVIGILVGLVGAFALTRFMRSVLFGVEPADPASFAIVSVLMLAVALVASYLPALRAARINPVLALKCE